MKQVTVEYANKQLRSYCTPAPITIRKLIRVFGSDMDTLHAVLNLYHQGLFQEYHMLPNNKRMAF